MKTGKSGLTSMPISRQYHLNMLHSQLGMRLARSNRISTKTGSTSSSEGNGDIFSSVRDFSKNYIVGSAPGISRALDNRPLSSSSFMWIIFHFLNAVLRTSGAPVFLNNPLSGFLILVAICVHDDGVGSAIAGTALLGMLVAATTAIWLFDEHDEQISEGTETFNGFIVGLILTDFNGLKQNPWLILVILLGSSMSVLVKHGLDFTLRQIELPSLNAPSIILVAVFNSCIVPISDVAPMPEIPTTSSAPVQLDWTEVLGGVIQTSGQIYACPNMLSSSLIYIALMVYSPILALLGLGGATIGTLIGAGLSTDKEAVYDGIWGTNSLLTAMALGGVFSKISIQTVCSAIAGAIIAACLYGGMSKIPEFPTLTFPFILSTLLLMGTTQQKRRAFPQKTGGISIGYIP